MFDRALIAKFLAHLPLCQAMDIGLADTEDLVFQLPYSPELIGDPATGVIHGGAISTLLDSALGSVAISHPENNFNTATVDLRIDYMRPAKPECTIFASAEVYQTTRHIAFLRGIAWDERRDKPIAMATGTFTFSKRLHS